MDVLLEFFGEFVTEERKNRIEEVLSQRTEHFHIVTEDTYQEHNASAIVRSCDCFGIQRMSVIQDINEFYVSHGMAGGAEKWVDINYYQESKEGFQECIDNLRASGYQIVATCPNPDAKKLEDFDVTQKSAIFFGREREGLSQVVLDQADSDLFIPMVGFTSSLNISVSVAIILQTLATKLRLNDHIDWGLNEQRKEELRLAWYYNSIPNNQRMLNAFLKSNTSIDKSALKRLIDF